MHAGRWERRLGRISAFQGAGDRALALVLAGTGCRATGEVVEGPKIACTRSSVELAGGSGAVAIEYSKPGCSWNAMSAV